MSPRKRKRSISSPKGIAGSSGGSLGVGDRESFASIQGIASPRHRHPPPVVHSPPSHYQPLYDRQPPGQSYSPPNSNAYQSHPHSFYHHPDSNYSYHNSPDHEPHPQSNHYSTHDHSSSNPNPPPNPHAPSHYNFANRAYAPQSDSGFNTFRVNPGPVPGPIAANASSGPPPTNASTPLHSPPMSAPPPGHHLGHVNEDLRFRNRSYSNSQPVASTSSFVPASHPHFSPPIGPSRDHMTAGEFEKTNRNGTRHSRRDRTHMGNESPMTSSDDDDMRYNPTTAGGRSRAMIKYLIIKAKYRFVVGESALLKDELESLKREEHHQWRLKEAGVDEIIKSFGPDTDRLIHDGDRQAQQYLLDRENDSPDWDVDMLRDLERERHAFREQERERERAKRRDHHHGENTIDVDHEDYGKIRSVGSDKDRDGDLDRMSANTQLSYRQEDRNTRQDEQPRPRSSSRSRHESHLDSRSFHYSAYPYRRTPPPSLPPGPDRDAIQTSYTNHSESPPLQSSGLDKEDVRHVTSQHVGGKREHERSEVKQDYGRHPLSHQRRSSEDVHGHGDVSPPLPANHRSPSLPLHSRQQSFQHFTPSPSHSHKESTERLDQPQAHREDILEHSKQSKHNLSYGSQRGTNSSSSPDPPSIESLSTLASTSPKAFHAKHKTMTTAHLSTQDQKMDRQDPAQYNKERSYYEESAKEKRYENAIDTTTSSSPANQKAADGVISDRNQQRSPLSTQSQSQDADRGPPQASAEHLASISPAPSIHHTQTQVDSAAETLQAPNEQNQSPTPLAPPLSPDSSSHLSPHTKSTPRVSHPLSSPEDTAAHDPPSARFVPSSGSHASASPRSSPAENLHSAAPIPTSPFRQSATPSAELTPNLSENQFKPPRSPEMSQTRSSRYAYAYYPNENKDHDDVDMTRNKIFASGGSSIESNGGFDPDTSTGPQDGQANSKVDTTAAVRDQVDVDRFDR